MKFGVSLTAALGHDGVLPGAGKPVDDVYVGLVQETASIAKRLNLPIVELVSFPPFDAEILQPRSEEIRNILESFEVSYHLPAWEINPAALNTTIREAAIGEQKKLIDFAASLGAKLLCMHPASFGAMRWAYGWFVDEIQQHVAGSIQQISEYAKEQGLALNIENLPYKSIFFTQPENFKEYLSEDVGKK